MSSSIILPDENLIEELTKEFQKENSRPDTLYVDGHVDLPFYMAQHFPDRGFNDLESGPVTPENTRKSGVRLFAAAVYCQDTYNGEQSLRHFQQNYDFAQKIFEDTLHVKSESDIQEIQDDEDIVGILFLLENADALTDNYSLALSLREKGIYTVGLTHAGTNRLGDGNAVMHSRGLTREGREVVKALLDNNILIDVAHLHPSCFLQLMDLVEVPVVSSHTGIRERCNIPRNLDLKQVEQIAERGGLVGITFDPNMLSPVSESSVEDIFVHLDTVVQRFGPDYAALGSDFCGYNIITEGMEDFTGVKTLKEYMNNHGYEDEAIEKIMGLNWLRIYKDVLQE